ncbi:hypothetical protein [Streptomyces sp. NBC_01334]|uniref:hypothetical protein n=1 Tax=Streptomyces sp. NBC_01334 TaxID=2903827 RepID=UPI002E121C85|nr:hypothetical protein OG736_11615 [Streptomyces sp. NBC_01334]
MTTTAPEHSDARAFVDPYAVDAADVRWPDPAEARWPDPADVWPDPADPDQDMEHLLPPNPAERLDLAIGPRDRRRIDLHAALTAAGIPPYPEDRDAIDQLSALSGSVNAALQRWLHHPR